MSVDSISISADRSFVSIPINGQLSRFHAFWLRDNARNAETVSPVNGQRVITLLDQPEQLEIESAELNTADNCRIKFVNDAVAYDYSMQWLAEHCYDKQTHAERGWINDAITLWGAEYQHQFPALEFPSIANDPTALKDWLEQIQRFGFATLSGLPEDPEALLKVVDLFGYVRETNYGKYFEVRAEINPTNLAYTGLGLQAHTDNPYRDPVPTLQILACLENTADGGESIVVDGFNAARILQQENQRHFDLLAGHCARFSYAGSSDVNLASRRPMIELNADGELIGVRFNNRSASAFTDIPFDVMPEYYAAYRHFAEIIERDTGEVSFKLQANELFIVDNTRVLHSRNAFSGAGKRWLRGCYADKDGLLSTLSVLSSLPCQTPKSGEPAHV